VCGGAAGADCPVQLRWGQRITEGPTGEPKAVRRMPREPDCLYAVLEERRHAHVYLESTQPLHNGVLHRPTILTITSRVCFSMSQRIKGLSILRDRTVLTVADDAVPSGVMSKRRIEKSPKQKVSNSERMIALCYRGSSLKRDHESDIICYKGMPGQEWNQLVDAVIQRGDFDVVFDYDLNGQQTSAFEVIRSTKVVTNPRLVNALVAVLPEAICSDVDVFRVLQGLGEEYQRRTGERVRRAGRAGGEIVGCDQKRANSPHQAKTRGEAARGPSSRAEKTETCPAPCDQEGQQQQCTVC